MNWSKDSHIGRSGTYYLKDMSTFKPVYWVNESGTPNDTMEPSDLSAHLFIDRVELPGSTIQEYGLPTCFHYEITRWWEM